MEIQSARFPDDLGSVRELFREYAAWLDVDLSFQGFEDELATLPGKYARPTGNVFLAREGAAILGCCAFRPHTHEICELKRLWVRPEARGNRVGKALVRRAEADARSAGYAAVVLDTLNTMTPAMNLYRSLGYAETAPYYHNPLPGSVYFRKDLC